MRNIDILGFIKTHITKRAESLFAEDIYNNRDLLTDSIEKKSILVIGGAGTIGSSYIKSILDYRPRKLVVVDLNENGLTELTRSLRSQYNQFVPEVFLTYPMDFGSSVFNNMISSNGPFDIVANFAAHKHVRSEKDQFSVSAMIDNNVFKAKDLLDGLLINKPDHYFCVSTDKAANPVNIMGASKQIMEDVIISYSDELKITTARFANVAFSNGSLLDGYLNRILMNQPISCPNDVKRFFVSPKESGEICMLASILGETGDIFFPKLGSEDLVSFEKITKEFFAVNSIKIIECTSEEDAKKIAIKRSGSDPYPVYFFESDTSGEKLYEEFYTSDDIVSLDAFVSLGIIKCKRELNRKQIHEVIKELKEIVNNNFSNKKSIVDALEHYLPNFNHIETGKNLDQKM